MSSVGVVPTRPVTSSWKSPCNRNDLPHDFRVPVVTIFAIEVELWPIRVNYESIILESATGGSISSVPCQENIDRLVPEWFRRKVHRCFSATIHDRE